MLHCSGDMARVGCNCYFSFWAIFSAFTALHPSPPNSSNFTKMKKKKKHLEVSSFTTSVPKIMIICYTVPEMWCVTDAIVIFRLGLFFALLTP